MNTIIQWTNTNNGFIMALLTFIYVVATILICVFNYKAAKATRKQTEESYKQFIENSRAHVIPKIIEVEGNMLCLVFENIGNDIASNLAIIINDEWIRILEKTKTFPESATKLRQLQQHKLFLTAGQKITYGLCIPENGKDDFKQLGKEKLKIEISYKSLNRFFKEEFEIPLDAYNYMLNISDYVRLTRKQNDKIDKISKELNSINKSINGLKDR